MAKDRYSQLYNDQSKSLEDATERGEQKTKSDAADHESLHENAIASDSDWESETENDDDDKQDEVVELVLDFHKQEVQKVERRMSGLRGAEIDPEMKDVKKIRQQMLERELTHEVRRQMLQHRQVHMGKRPTKDNGDAVRVIKGCGKEDDALQWPHERRVW